MARTGAIRIQRASGELADRLRKRGRQTAVKDIAVMHMAGLDEVRGGKLARRSAEATLGRGEARKPGPLPDPAWTAGYREAITAVMPDVRVGRRAEADAQMAANWDREAGE
jgi:hypothetical protein